MNLVTNSKACKQKIIEYIWARRPVFRFCKHVALNLFFLLVADYEAFYLGLVHLLFTYNKTDYVHVDLVKQAT